MTELEQEVLHAFHSGNFYYYSTTRRTYSNFIDGLAWVGLLVGACLKAGTPTALRIAACGVEYMRNILNVGPDARTYAPEQVTDSWIKSDTMPDMWYKKKAQSFAGPVGLQFAINNGAPLETPFDVMGQAKLFTRFGWLFGYALNWPIVGKWLRQHVNSMFLAYLITGEKPPKSMEWITEDNPFYAYIAGVKMDVQSPPNTRYVAGHTVDRDEVVPMAKRKPSTWIWRGWPKSEYVADDEPVFEDWSYTRAAELTAVYLQSTL